LWGQEPERHTWPVPGDATRTLPFSWWEQRGRKNCGWNRGHPEGGHKTRALYEDGESGTLFRRLLRVCRLPLQVHGKKRTLTSAASCSGGVYSDFSVSSARRIADAKWIPVRLGILGMSKGRIGSKGKKPYGVVPLGLQSTIIPNHLEPRRPHVLGNPPSTPKPAPHMSHQCRRNGRSVSQEGASHR
jgi:hypothetical protein